MDDLWRFHPWCPDTSRTYSRAAVPEAGGWLYQFRAADGAWNHVFVPDMSAWTADIAAAIAKILPVPAPPLDGAVSVFLDTSNATHASQPVPFASTLPFSRPGRQLAEDVTAVAGGGPTAPMRLDRPGDGAQSHKEGGDTNE